jgi:hypothetical protein
MNTNLAAWSIHTEYCEAQYYHASSCVLYHELCSLATACFHRDSFAGKKLVMFNIVFLFLYCFWIHHPILFWLAELLLKNPVEIDSHIWTFLCRWCARIFLYLWFLVVWLLICLIKFLLGLNFIGDHCPSYIWMLTSFSRSGKLLVVISLKSSYLIFLLLN